MEKKTERILKLISFVRDNDGMYNLEELSEKLDIPIKILRQDIIIPIENSFLTVDIKTKKVSYVRKKDLSE